MPRLSVSVIARNEASRLAGFLECLAAYGAEVVLLDTGSTDDTAEIARAAGCLVHHFEWCDDFSAARNEALRYNRGRWVLSLDVDERIAEDDWAALHALTDGPHDRCYRFITRNYTDDINISGFVEAAEDARSQGARGWFPSAKVRLFPNVPGIAFEGVVHELIGPSLERQGIQVVDTEIPIHHYPMLQRTEADRQTKQRFYLDLGRKKLAKEPRNPKAHHELGDQLIDLGEIGPALRAYREAVRLDPDNALWLKSLGGALLLAGQVQSAIQALRLSAQRDPSSAECWRNLGVAWAQGGDWPAARDAFQQAHARDEAHRETFRYLALARHACGDNAGAVPLLERLLRVCPTHEEGAALYRNIMADLGRKAAAEEFFASLRS